MSGAYPHFKPYYTHEESVDIRPKHDETYRTDATNVPLVASVPLVPSVAAPVTFEDEDDYDR